MIEIYKEIVMWKCIRCFAEVSFGEVDAEIDDFGIFFLCPYCDRRNELVNVGGDSEDSTAVLKQTGK
jgi:NAD-dependent SIR2 family protein deacetylase